METLVSLSLKVIATHLGLFDVSSFSYFDSDTFDMLIDKVIVAHAKRKREEAESRMLTKQVLTVEYLVELEAQCPEVAQTHKAKLDQLWWRLLVNQDFHRGKFDRPDMFDVPFGEFAKDVRRKGEELLELCRLPQPKGGIEGPGGEGEDPRRKIVNILGGFQRLPVSVKLLEETRVGKVVQKLVKKYAKGFYVSERAVALATSMLGLWKGLAAKESEEEAKMEEEERSETKSSVHNSARDAILYGRATNWKNMYVVLNNRKRVIKGHSVKMRKLRDEMKGNRASVAKVETLGMGKKRKAMETMLLGRAEREKLVKRGAGGGWGGAPMSAGKLTFNKLRRETKVASDMRNGVGLARGGGGGEGGAFQLVGQHPVTKERHFRSSYPTGGGGGGGGGGGKVGQVLKFPKYKNPNGVYTALNQKRLLKK
ncbi:hypothetical protein TrVE_jg2975 [Triparma verrucosa]|uniref:TFIIS N-terminal domain-containing protein n=1 Tax=Triparma verrucosa TaxID=1606542 RepID=A0A9W7FFP3_9STRA|nr:hypothetical protein TrVE_jg2975 [Triparma verrucosa]